MENNTSKEKGLVSIGKWQEGQKCPACSSERDKGGRLAAFKKKHWYLKCQRCKWAATRSKLHDKDRKRREQDKWLFTRQSLGTDARRLIKAATAKKLQMRDAKAS